MEKKEEIEAKKQLVGIKIITIAGIAFYGFWFLYGIYSILFDYFGEFDLFFLFILSCLLLLYTMGLIGLIKRKAYAILISRLVLVLSGLIWLIWFWPRLSNPLVQSYLNYKHKKDNGVMHFY
jgi:FlaA1/EpsC-like NDP-sugar epimerase